MAITAALNSISITAVQDENEVITDEFFLNLQQTGKNLVRRCHAVEAALEEDGMSDFYEEFGNVLSRFKRKRQIEVILKSFFDEAFEFNDLEATVFLFTEMKMSAIQSDDVTAVQDVDVAFYQAAEKCDAEKGCAEAEKFKKLFEYSMAGAAFGYDMALAKKRDDAQFAEYVGKKAAKFCNSLTGTEFISVFNKSYDQFAANS